MRSSLFALRLKVEYAQTMLEYSSFWVRPGARRALKRVMEWISELEKSEAEEKADSLERRVSYLEAKASRKK